MFTVTVTLANQRDETIGHSPAQARFATGPEEQNGSHRLHALSGRSRNRPGPNEAPDVAAPDVVATDQFHHAGQYAVYDRWRRKRHPLSSAWRRTSAQIEIGKLRHDGRS